MAEESSHVYDQAYTLYGASWIHQLRREAQAAQEQAEAAIELSVQHGFTHWLANATMLRGWALVEQGQAEEGLAKLHQGLADMQTIGVMVLRPYFLALLSEAYGKAGQVDEGLAALAKALAMVEWSKERHYEAELYRLKGELLWRTEAKVEAESHFRQALELARNQQSKSLELRAAMSLGRLWQKHSKKAQARQRLAEICGWFNEGADTADLIEAKSLQEELA
jgi:predicted ATPase